MLCVLAVYKEEVESIIEDLALDDVVLVEHKGGDLYIRLPIYGDECSLSDALDYSYIPHTKLRRS